MPRTASKPTVEVRRIGPDDWALLRSVRLAGLEEAPYAFRRTVEEARRYRESQWRQQAGDRTLEGKPSATFVAVRPDGSGAGMAVGIDDGEAVHVVGVWVAPEDRGSGVIDRLLETVARWAPRPRLTLTVAIGNDRARRVYERHGFVVRGEEDGEWVMERPG